MPNLAIIGEGVGTGAPTLNLVYIASRFLAVFLTVLRPAWVTIHTDQGEIWRDIVHTPCVHSLMPNLALIGERARY